MNDGRRVIAAAALAAVAAALAGCGGGSGGGAATAMPDPGAAMPPPAPEPAPDPGAAPVAPAPRGETVAEGIENIPLDARRLTNARVAELYAIMEYRASNDGGDTPDGGTVHGRTVRNAACRSYIAGCSDPDGAESALPYSFFIAETDPDDATRRNSPLRQTRELLDAVPDTTRIVSISVRPRGVGPIELHGTSLPFAVIQGAGNDGRASFFDPGVVFDAAENRFRRVREENRRDDGNGGVDPGAGPVTEAQNAAWLNILAAIKADKVLYIAGYRPPAGGLYTRDSRSTGCAGIDDGCLFAPFTIEGAAGTSVGTPHVAAALASVLSVFPETEGEELVRLAKACAVADPRLGGLGRADFSCMTTLDANGEWRVVASGEFARLVAAPAAMNAIAFPGDARVAAAFAGPNGRRVTLATRSPGRFRFSAGPPANPFGAGGAPGFFAILVDDGRTTAFGGGWLSPEGLFAAASWGGRDGFFGLDDRFGYDGARSTDAAAGHRNLFARFSRQHGHGPLVGSARGAALGFTARTGFDLAPGVSAEVSAHADRFLGGTARTAFGQVTMEKGPWSREARVSAAWRPAPAASLAVEGARHWSPGGEGGLEGRIRARLRF